MAVERYHIGDRHSERAIADPKDVELGTLMYMAGNGYLSLNTE